MDQLNNTQIDQGRYPKAIRAQPLRAIESFMSSEANFVKPKCKPPSKPFEERIYDEGIEL